jgi:hypothetical protein
MGRSIRHGKLRHGKRRTTKRRNKRMQKRTKRKKYKGGANYWDRIGVKDDRMYEINAFADLFNWVGNDKAEWVGEWSKNCETWEEGKHDKGRKHCDLDRLNEKNSAINMKLQHYRPLRKVKIGKRTLKNVGDRIQELWAIIGDAEYFKDIVAKCYTSRQNHMVEHGGPWSGATKFRCPPKSSWNPGHTVALQEYGKGLQTMEKSIKELVEITEFIITRVENFKNKEKDTIAKNIKASKEKGEAAKAKAVAKAARQREEEGKHLVLFKEWLNEIKDTGLTNKQTCIKIAIEEVLQVTADESRQDLLQGLSRAQYSWKCLPKEWSGRSLTEGEELNNSFPVDFGIAYQLVIEAKGIEDEAALGAAAEALGDVPKLNATNYSDQFKRLETWYTEIPPDRCIICNLEYGNDVDRNAEIRATQEKIQEIQHRRTAVTTATGSMAAEFQALIEKARGWTRQRRQQQDAVEQGDRDAARVLGVELKGLLNSGASPAVIDATKGRYRSLLERIQGAETARDRLMKNIGPTLESQDRLNEKVEKFDAVTEERVVASLLAYYEDLLTRLSDGGVYDPNKPLHDHVHDCILYNLSVETEKPLTLNKLQEAFFTGHAHPARYLTGLRESSIDKGDVLNASAIAADIYPWDPGKYPSYCNEHCDKCMVPYVNDHGYSTEIKHAYGRARPIFFKATLKELHIHRLAGHGCEANLEALTSGYGDIVQRNLEATRLARPDAMTFAGNVYEGFKDLNSKYLPYLVCHHNDINVMDDGVSKAFRILTDAGWAIAEFCPPYYQAIADEFNDGAARPHLLEALSAAPPAT